MTPHEHLSNGDTVTIEIEDAHPGETYYAAECAHLGGHTMVCDPSTLVTFVPDGHGTATFTMTVHKDFQITAPDGSAEGSVDCGSAMCFIGAGHAGADLGNVEISFRGGRVAVVAPARMCRPYRAAAGGPVQPCPQVRPGARGSGDRLHPGTATDREAVTASPLWVGVTVAQRPMIERYSRWPRRSALKRSLPMHSRARDQAQLVAETRMFFHRRQRQPHMVRGYFGGPTHPQHPRIEPFEFRVNTRPLHHYRPHPAASPTLGSAWMTRFGTPSSMT